MLEYTVTRQIDVPNEIAKKLKENENAPWGDPWSWYVKYATLYYCDEEGEEHEIQSDEYPNDLKHDGGKTWDEPEESEDEPEAKPEVIFDKAAGIDHTDKSFSTAVNVCVGCNSTENVNTLSATGQWMCVECWT